MSLSFVSKAIQTTREDGAFEEKEIVDASETTGGTGVTAGGKPLFEQLRQNKEQEDAEREELQRSIMRGTLALDEDDAAHLEQLNQQRMQRESEKYQQTQQELASFRAAQADRLEKQHQQKDSTNTDDGRQDETVAFESATKPSAVAAKPAFAPTILKKKRKRGDDEKSIENDNVATKKDSRKQEPATMESTGEKKRDGGASGAALSSLLTGYSSSSSDEEE